MDTHTARILAVDLDGTLLGTDVLWEALTELVRRKPYLLLVAPFAALRGRVHFKHWLARHVQPDFDSLPINKPVADFVRSAKRNGQMVVLATAAFEPWAQQIADRLGCFDTVIGTDMVNLSGKHKLERLRSVCDGRAFDYIGDRGVDIPLWQAATDAFIVGNAARYQRRIGKAFSGTFSSPRPTLRDWYSLLRIEQWSKNLLVFAPLLLAHKLLDSAALGGAVAAALMLSIVASALYVFNDLLDVPTDRQHPTKRLRPLASGTISLPIGWLCVMLGLCIGLGGAFIALPATAAELVALYAAASIGYSLALKRQPIVDILVLGGLYTLRILIGGSASNTEVSAWLLGFSLVFFASLALLKRHSEVVQLQHTADILASSRPYSVRDEQFLFTAGIATAVMAVVILIVYVTSDRARALYAHPDRLWFILPLLLFWILRMWRLSLHNRLRGDPLTVSLRDPASIATGAAIIALVEFIAR